jgi:hypothetical protein
MSRGLPYNMASFIKPIVIDEDPAPPWGWNPIATFQTAFNDAQRNKREQEKMALEMELAEILLPYKKETAALQLEKLKQDVELSTLLTAQKRKAQSTAHPSIMEGIRNPSGPPRSAGLFNQLSSQINDEIELPAP